MAVERHTPDLYQIWYSSQSAGEGSNFVSFINEVGSIKYLNSTVLSLDENKRIELIKRWQKLIYDEQPYTFLWSPKSRYIFDQRFKNTRWYSRAAAR
jgi:peptide/nickel transport system substrate-binding protein